MVAFQTLDGGPSLDFSDVCEWATWKHHGEWLPESFHKSLVTIDIFTSWLEDNPWCQSGDMLYCCDDIARVLLAIGMVWRDADAVQYLGDDDRPPELENSKLEFEVIHDLKGHCKHIKSKLTMAVLEASSSNPPLPEDDFDSISRPVSMIANHTRARNRPAAPTVEEVKAMEKEIAESDAGIHKSKTSEHHGMVTMIAMTDLLLTRESPKGGHLW